MGLSQSIFHPEFVTHHQATVNSAATGRVKIERVIGRGEWTPEAGMGSDNFMAIYEGPAMVEAITNASRREFVQDANDSQMVQVQIGFDTNEIPWPDDFTFQSNDRVTVTENLADPMMEGITVYVHGWLGSTHSWARKLFCRHNTKQG